MFSSRLLSMKFFVPALAVIACCCSSAKAISISVADASTTHSQNFNGLATTGSNHAMTLTGWYLFNASEAAATYSPSTGSSPTGGFYSLGSDADRALGGVGAGSFSGWIAVAFTNTSGSALGGFDTSWDGEQWRAGASTIVAHSMVFQYGFGDTFAEIAPEDWLTPGGNFNWSSPIYGLTSSPYNIDGNSAGLVPARGGEIDVTWEVGQTLWFRWHEKDDTGNDHALAIDNFTFAALAGASESVPDALPFVWVASALLGCLVLSRRRLRSAE